jgi:hypothetical protein
MDFVAHCCISGLAHPPVGMKPFSFARFGGNNVTAIARLLGASAAAVVLLFGVAVHAQTTEPKKKPAPKVVSACKGLDETACKAKSDECLWIVPKTGKQKPYCRKKAAPKKAAPAKDATPKK